MALSARAKLEKQILDEGKLSWTVKHRFSNRSANCKRWAYSQSSAEQLDLAVGLRSHTDARLTFFPPSAAKR
jgi:hypothetical protein